MFPHPLPILIYLLPILVKWTKMRSPHPLPLIVILKLKHSNSLANNFQALLKIYNFAEFSKFLGPHKSTLSKICIYSGTIRSKWRSGTPQGSRSDDTSDSLAGVGRSGCKQRLLPQLTGLERGQLAVRGLKHQCLFVERRQWGHHGASGGLTGNIALT